MSNMKRSILMKLFKEENINLLMEGIITDTYSDEIQHAEGKPYLPEAEAFIKRNLRLDLPKVGPCNILEVGCGSGASFRQISEITHAIEPCYERYTIAKSIGKDYS